MGEWEAWGYVHVDVHTEKGPNDVILSSSHAKNLTYFVPEFGPWTE